MSGGELKIYLVSKGVWLVYGREHNAVDCDTKIWHRRPLGVLFFLYYSNINVVVGWPG